jgi:hypothetical protein
MIRGNQDLISVLSFPETSSTSNNRKGKYRDLYSLLPCPEASSRSKKVRLFSQERGKRILLPICSGNIQQTS